MYCVARIDALYSDPQFSDEHVLKVVHECMWVSPRCVVHPTSSPTSPHKANPNNNNPDPDPDPCTNIAVTPLFSRQ
jgi:hypothetical protein